MLISQLTYKIKVMQSAAVSSQVKLDLEKAFDSILKDDKTGYNPLPEPLGFSYIKSSKQKIFEDLAQQINREDYAAAELLAIDMPKSNFTIRPMARPHIDDWIAYQAIIDHLASEIAGRLSKRSFSALRYNNPKKRIDPWIEFDQASREFYDAGHHFVVSTDIAGYFENIDLRELRKKLVNYLTSEPSIKLVNFLCNKLLKDWNTGRVNRFGIPQGPTASFFLGDTYLDNIDREMEALPGYIRYMDDVHIFCKSEIEAKLALIKIIKALRKYKLHINAKKTRILKYDEIENTIFDPEKLRLDSIQSAFSSQDLAEVLAVTDDLQMLFKEGFDEHNLFGDRHIRFAIFRLSILKVSGVDFDEKAVIGPIMDNFHAKPQLADKFCKFLSLFKDKEEIPCFLINFLFSQENIYDWQELHILSALLEMGIELDDVVLKKMLNRFKDNNRHYATRSLYCLLVGKHGRNSDKELLVDEFLNVHDQELQKYIALAVQELGSTSRNEFYGRISSRLPEGYISYIKSLAQPMYFQSAERFHIDFFEEIAPDYYF